MLGTPPYGARERRLLRWGSAGVMSKKNNPITSPISQNDSHLCNEPHDRNGQTKRRSIAIPFTNEGHQNRQGESTAVAIIVVITSPSLAKSRVPMFRLQKDNLSGRRQMPQTILPTRRFECRCYYLCDAIATTSLPMNRVQMTAP